MTETIQTAMDRLMTISVEPQDYVAEDGLLYCGSCKTPKEAFFPNGKKLFGRDRHPAECRCRQATREKQEKEERARLHYEKVQRLKLQGFTDWAMQHWTFANDHGQNPQMQLAQRYVAHWPEMQEKNVGLLLWGGVGTGKSFMAGCISEFAEEDEYSRQSSKSSSAETDNVLAILTRTERLGTFVPFSIWTMYSRLQLTFAARTSCVRFDFER